MVHADSAGVPFEGRAFHANEAADDDGSADPRIVDAVRRFRAREVEVAEVLEVLAAVRLLVPLLTERGDEGIGAHGQFVDKTQELALVTVAGPDGRAVLPAFTSVDTMRVWDPVARPIPVAAPRAALAAASDDLGAIVLDPGSESEFVVRRTAFEAVATQVPFTPCYADERVLAEFVEAAAAESAVHAVRLSSGDPDARFAGPELLVQLTLEPGLDRDALDALLTRLGEGWAASTLIADRVDSIGVRLQSA